MDKIESLLAIFILVLVVAMGVLIVATIASLCDNDCQLEKTIELVKSCEFKGYTRQECIDMVTGSKERSSNYVPIIIPR